MIKNGHEKRDNLIKKDSKNCIECAVVKRFYRSFD